MLLRALLLTLAAAPSAALRPSFAQAPPLATTSLAQTPDEPYPRLCAGNLDGSHTSTVELLMAGNDEDSSSSSWSHYLASQLGLGGSHHANSLSLNLPAGSFKGFTSSRPGVGFILALWDNDDEGEEREVNESAFGMAILQQTNTTSGCHDIYAWTAPDVLTPGVCLSRALPPDFVPSLHCVGQGSSWSSPPEERELFEGFPVLDFTSVPSSEMPCTIRKRVSAATGCVESACARQVPEGPLPALLTPTPLPPPRALSTHAPPCAATPSRSGALPPGVQFGPTPWWTPPQVPLMTTLPCPRSALPQRSAPLRACAPPRKRAPPSRAPAPPPLPPLPVRCVLCLVLAN